MEEDPDLRARLCRLLRARGHAPIAAKSCLAAAQLSVSVDGVVADVELHDGSGIELVKHLIANSLATRAVFHTACDAPSKLASAARFGHVIPRDGNCERVLATLER